MVYFYTHIGKHMFIVTHNCCLVNSIRLNSLFSLEKLVNLGIFREMVLKFFPWLVNVLTFSALNIKKKIQLQQIPTTSIMPVSTMESAQVSLIEAKIALHLAMHGKMSTSTCLMKCLRSCVSHEGVQASRLARTKCTQVCISICLAIFVDSC